MSKSAFLSRRRLKETKSVFFFFNVWNRQSRQLPPWGVEWPWLSCCCWVLWSLASPSSNQWDLRKLHLGGKYKPISLCISWNNQRPAHHIDSQPGLLHGVSVALLGEEAISLWLSCRTAWSLSRPHRAASFLECQTQKVWRIFLWGKNLGKFLIYLGKGKLSGQTNSVQSLGRALMLCETWSNSLPSGQHYHTWSKLQAESIAEHFFGDSHGCCNEKLVFLSIVGNLSH